MNDLHVFNSGISAPDSLCHDEPHNFSVRVDPCKTLPQPGVRERTVTRNHPTQAITNIKSKSTGITPVVPPWLHVTLFQLQGTWIHQRTTHGDGCRLPDRVFAHHSRAVVGTVVQIHLTELRIVPCSGNQTTRSSR